MNRRKKELLAFLVIGSIFMVCLYYLQKSIKGKSKGVESDTEPKTLPLKKVGFWENLKRSFIKDLRRDSRKNALESTN
jgi:hypothetical protein